LNTNLGAIAALSAADGQIRWLTLYPRSGKYVASADPTSTAGDHLTRDLNPCVFYRGSLFVAPVDFEEVLALDAATGQVLWKTPRATRDIVHLLGVGGDNLIASGRKLYFFNIDTSQLVYSWPDDNANVQAFGRGILVDDQVYFPTRKEIHVFRQSPGDPASARSPPGWEAREPIPLTPRDGGNLVAAHGWLLIATPQKLIAFGPGIPQAKPNEHEVTSSGPRAH
jgi:outer membrane protein assembly factor BamB